MKKKDSARFNKSMKRKLVVVFAVIMLALIALIGRLAYIIIVSGSKYARQVLAQQTYDSRTIAYKRGDIVDTNGTVLATSEKVYNVILDAKVLNDDPDLLDPTLDALTKCFPQLDRTELQTYIQENPTSQYHKILENESADAVSAYQALQESGDADSESVWFEAAYVREYPYNSLAASLIGFTDSTGAGALGIE